MCSDFIWMIYANARPECNFCYAPHCNKIAPIFSNCPVWSNLGLGVYSKPSERSKMELFVKIINGFQLYSNQQNFHYMKKCFDMNLSPYLLILKGFFRGIFAKRLEVLKLVLKVLPYSKDSKERPYSRFCSCLVLTFFLKMANL